MFQTISKYRYKITIMKKRFLKLFLPLAALACIAMTVSSCSDDKHYYYYEGANFTTVTYTINRNKWEWNDDYERYEYVARCPEITDYIFEEGTVTGGVFITEDGYDDKGRPVSFEVVKTLPFVQSYYDVPADVTYTETISFDYTPGWVAFYIQASDLSDTDEYLATYDFKLNIFYQP